MAKRNYINPSIIRDVMARLEEYKNNHPCSKTPLLDFIRSGASEAPEDVRAICVRAAQRLKWNVTRSKGHVYENGYFIW